MENPTLTADQLNLLAKGLDAVLATQASLQDVMKVAKQQPELLDASLAVEQEGRYLRAQALLHIAQQQGEEPIATVHGVLSPQGVRQFVVDQEVAGNIVFVNAAYRTRLLDYIASLSPANR